MIIGQREDILAWSSFTASTEVLIMFKEFWMADSCVLSALTSTVRWVSLWKKQHTDSQTCTIIFRYAVLYWCIFICIDELQKYPLNNSFHTTPLYASIYHTCTSTAPCISVSPSPPIKCCSTTGTYSWQLHQVLKWNWSCCLELLWRCHQGLRIQTQAHTDVQVWLEMLLSPPPWPGEGQAEPIYVHAHECIITVHVPLVLLWRQSTVMPKPPSMTIITSCIVFQVTEETWTETTVLECAVILISTLRVAA